MSNEYGVLAKEDGTRASATNLALPQNNKRLVLKIRILTLVKANYDFKVYPALKN